MSRFRSAITGRWVGRLFARKNPRTTVEERTPTPLRPEGTAWCPYCGQRISESAAECRYCGTDLMED